MDKPLVIVTEQLEDAPANWLAKRVDLRWHRYDSDAFDALLPKAAALVVRTYTQVSTQLLARGKSLRVVGRAGVGLDNFDLPACKAHGVRVVHTPEANTQAVVEYVIALILDDIRPRPNFSQAITGDAFHHQRKVAVGRQFDTMTLGILGFGRIGKRLGKAAAAMGVRVLACDLLPEAPLRAAVDFPFEYVDHDALLARSDVVSVHVDGRAENRRLIDAEALSKMRGDAMLINASRGFVVDPAALADWLVRVESHGGRAVLDVHEPEPPGADYPLLNLPNTRLLPHLASRTKQAMDNMGWVVRDIVDVLDGKEPRWPAA